MCTNAKICCTSGNPLEGLDSWWTESNSTLSPCFTHTILIWIPCAIFWLTLPIEILKFFQIKARNTNGKGLLVESISKRRALFVARLVSLFFILIFSVIRLASIQRIDHPTATVLSAFVLQFLTLASIIALTIFRNFRFVKRPSAYTWVTLCAFAAFGIPEFISSIQQAKDGNISMIGLITFFLQYLSTILAIIAFSISELKADEDFQQWPEEYVSFPNILLIKGYRNVLTLNDLFTVGKEEQTVTVYKTFEKNLRRYFGPNSTDGDKKKKPGDWAMVKVIVGTFYKALLAGAVLQFIDATFTFIGPFVISRLMKFVSNADEPQWHGITLVGVLFVVTALRSFAKQYHYHYMNKFGVRSRAAIVAAVYRKALTMSPEAKRNSNTGEIVNLMAVDSTRFLDTASLIQFLWSAPLQVAFGLYLIYGIVGHAVWAGVGIMAIILSCTSFVSKQMQKLQIKQLEEKDRRMKLLTEMLSGMKVVKLYAWEPAFEKLIEKIRARELRFLKFNYAFFGFFEVSYCCTNLLACMGIFGVYSLINPAHNVTAQVAFVVMTIFNIIYIPFTTLPYAASYIMMMLASVTRLRKYFCNDDLEPYVQVQHNKDTPITIDNASFTWESDSEECTLKDINLSVKPGELVAIVGSVGCGKSSLINAMCGEMIKRNGSISINGSISYVAQQAWIQNLTVRDNILFGLPYNERRYQKIVQACALKPDFALFANGDLTVIGEKGSNLSGGQKQRISLARAVYQDTDIYLLDDPLSAVDVHVGKTIFDGVIGPNGLLRKKARVFVTHGIHYLPLCDNIILMQHGRFFASGSFDELAQKYSAYAEFMEQNEMLEEDDRAGRKNSNANVMSNQRQLSRQITGASVQELPVSDIILERLSSLRHSRASMVSDRRKSAVRKESEVEDYREEEVQVGRIGWKTYWFYIRHAGISILLHGVFIALSELSYMGGTMWLEIWTDTVPANMSNITDNSRVISVETGLGVLGALTFTQVITTFLFCLFLVKFFARASTRIHKQLLTRILRAPMSFFDTTPSGRLTNRFGKDTSTLDNQMPYSATSVIHFLIILFTFMTPMFYATPTIAVVLIPLLGVYLLLQKFYVASSTQFRRLEAVTRSPIYSHFQESIDGITTIRAYRQQNRFAEESDRLVDINDAAQMTFLGSSRWLGVHLDLIGNLVAAATSISAVLLRSTMLPGLVGLAVSYALGITDIFNWGIRELSILETEAVALERIKEYMDIDSEAEWTSIKSKSPAPTKDWPKRGTVEFKNYSTCYRPGLPLVLKDFRCRIYAGEKVGVVGRTGAGKSSLTLALFRLVEPVNGSIFIDDLDISEMGLHELRQKLTIIPQDPVLFSGTMRQNIDPFEQYTDAELYQALQLSHLTTFIASLDDGLSHEISEGGANLSVGQRQLICLARALLKKSQILVLDEATASVDVETDALIQRTVKEQFANCTVITIAHRLNTILDYDRIMVLDSGRLVEFDSPASLIDDETSEFGRMIQEAGIRVAVDDLKVNVKL